MFKHLKATKLLDITISKEIFRRSIIELSLREVRASPKESSDKRKQLTIRNT